MIVAAPLCPAPPLLVRKLTGAQQVAADLRDACLASVAELTAAAPGLVAVVGAAGSTGIWGGTPAFDLARYAPGPVLSNGQGPAGAVGQGPAGAVAGAVGRSRARAVAGPAELPSALGVGSWLLGEAGSSAPRVLQSVGADEPPSRCAAIGARLSGRAECRVRRLGRERGQGRPAGRAAGHRPAAGRRADGDRPPGVAGSR